MNSAFHPLKSKNTQSGKNASGFEGELEPRRVSDLGSDYELPLEKPVVCVVGPTASGKTELAQRIALHLNGEVISADSMQIYKGMDIGTGKIPLAARKVPHHGFDLVQPGEAYSAALFQSYARGVFADLDTRKKRSVLAGGTGLYVRAAIDSYEFPQGEQVENPVRAAYTAYAEEHGPQALWELLEKRDPQSAAAIHPNNVRRVVRAFEMLEEGISYADQLKNLAQIPQSAPAVFIGLQVDPELLNRRIEQRVDDMLELGLVDEVRGLLERGFREGVTAPQAIGYKEIVAYLDGQTTLEEAVEQIKTSTRRYAKRQRTWYRKDSRIHWLAADSGDADALCAAALEIIDVHDGD